MPNVYVDVTVEIDDIYEELDSYDIDRLVKWLHEDGHLSEYMRANNIEAASNQIADAQFIDDCMALSDAYYRMSEEEIATVRALAAKYKFH